MRRRLEQPVATGWLDQLPAGDRARFDPSIKTAAELAAAAAGSGGANRANRASAASGASEPVIADLRASAA